MKNLQLFTGVRKHFWFIGLAVVVFDQATKHLFFTLPAFRQPVEVVPNFFHIIRKTNPAAAFSLGPESPQFYVIVTFIGLGLLIWFLSETPSRRFLPVAGLGAVAGGAVGNLIDRIFWGEVRDFISVHWYDIFYWPAFNVADAAICVGVAIILIETFRSFKAPGENE